ncbi:XdhC family protein [Parasporobacterium paucivorans]|uniref:Xanthine dehydrogenase accessory factor n=1 Tax=Parasporobacterium paucivorans DSM 15970 TaxID=1122934 RepID=A0A1M6HUK6_9FIRM|nr:XdhC/CoxI family protein [Parasporobacterium paucivorans]SHJ25875.1 xanthine dehydrogenase accessory factor [Parasporobacterium paucivorans DSM 15970]
MSVFYEKIPEIDKSGNVAAITVVSGENIGEKLLVSQEKVLFSSVENGFLEKTFSNDLGWKKTGTYQLEAQKVFFERIGSEKKLVICGGGHISIPLIKIGLMLGFHVTVLEDRPMYADNARNANADRVICDCFAKGLEQIEGDEDTYFVIVTRGHRHDESCLESISQKRNAYIGMIGSRIRVKKVRETLLEKGIDKEILDKIHSPIGTDIKAETPEEIAVSIMGEIILVKNTDSRDAGYPKEIISEINSTDCKEKRKILATIVSRKGSAPRKCGAKMLICSDGRAVGTIGGGCMESDIFKKGLSLLQGGSPMICEVDMTNTDAEAEGMVCGGKIEVFLEPVF